MISTASGFRDYPLFQEAESHSPRKSKRGASRPEHIENGGVTPQQVEKGSSRTPADRKGGVTPPASRKGDVTDTSRSKTRASHPRPKKIRNFKITGNGDFKIRTRQESGVILRVFRDIVSNGKREKELLF